MLFTLEHVRANIRNRDGRRVFFLGKGDQLTSDARDFLSHARIPVLPAQEAKIDRYRLLGGGFLEEKPEHMTHLYGDVLVPKTHPRIRFRGAMDLLEAELLLACLAAPRWQKELEEILDFARKLIRWEVMEEPVPQEGLCAMEPEEIRRRSHFPQEYYGQPHFMPAPADGAALLQLNRARCAARQAELAAVAAFLDREGNLQRADLVQALNRLSSILYILMIRQKAEGRKQE